MRWTRPGAGAPLRLAYCLNLHPAEDLAGVLAGLRDVTLPLRERVAPGARFGVGPYLAAGLARHLASPAGAADLARLRAFLDEHDLDAFTFNAFPFGGFHAAGLKERVFEPAWDAPERLAFTLDVARVAAALGSRAEVVSVSTHTGCFGAVAPPREAALARGLLAAARGLAELEDGTGRRVVMSVEPEPGASCGRTDELPRLRDALRAAAAADRDPAASTRALERHLGTCLDACHAAVEFEPPADALSAARADGAPLGKLQFTSALALTDPSDPDARAALLALDEPRYLHQVRARASDERLAAADLPALARALADPGTPWLRAPEWRCHFHVPVDLAAVGEALGTTRDAADALLDLVLDPAFDPGTPERHVEIETYTWDVLPAPARTATDLVDGLAREYAHVLARLRAAGWSPAPDPAPDSPTPV